MDVNLVPATFFFPHETAVKGKGNIRLLRPNCIVQIITALETGIRHQHIQWLDVTFNRYVLVQNVIPEDLYRLFVNTDKVRKQAWTPHVAGRVIQVLK